MVRAAHPTIKNNMTHAYGAIRFAIAPYRVAVGQPPTSYTSPQATHCKKKEKLPWEAQYFRGHEIVTSPLPTGTAAGLGGVVALAFDAIEIVAAYVAGDVLAVEAGTIEALDLGIALARGFDQVVEVLVNELVGADDRRNLVFRAAVADQLLARRHVDAVHIGEAHRRRGRGEVHLARAGVTRHLDDLLGGRAAHDGVVHQQHVLAPELDVDGVQLLAHRLLAFRLAGHDEGAADIAVLDETLTVRQGEFVRHLQGGGARGIRDRNHDVNINVRPDALDLVGQAFAHAQPRLVHVDAVYHRVGTGHVHELEDARRVHRLLGALLAVHLAVHIHDDALARRDVAYQIESHDIERDRLRGEHVLRPLVGLALAEHQRADAVRVAEGEYAVARDQHGDSIGAAAAPVHGGHGAEQVIRRETQLRHGLQLVRENIEQDLGIRIGVDVAQVLAVQLVLQLIGIREITVVRQRQAIGGVHVKRLGLGRGIAARGGIAHVADAHVALEAEHVALLEHVAHLAVVLAQMDALILAGEDTRGILTAMLQNQHAIVNGLINRSLGKNPDNAAHAAKTSCA